jgi:N-acetylmuramoyl-L-alanine amidase
MNVSEVLLDVTQLLGKELEVQGIFVLVGDDGYLVDTIDARDERANAVRIDIPEILNVVMENVPPSAGSKYYYLDPATISGRISKCEEGDEFRYRISDIDKFIIDKSGHVISVFD